MSIALLGIASLNFIALEMFNKKLLPALALIAAAFGAQASTVSVGAAADDWLSTATAGNYSAFVTSGNAGDGYLRTFGTSGPYNRSALEFSLAGIAPGSVVSSATFTIQSRGTSVAGGSFNFWGYGGDGAITNADGLMTGNLIGTALTQGGTPQYVIDVTAFIQSLVNANDDYAGILITLTPQGSFFGSDFVSSEGQTFGHPNSDKPKLTVNFEAGNAVPVPGTLALLAAAGLAGALTRRSRRALAG